MNEDGHIYLCEDEHVFLFEYVNMDKYIFV